MSPLKLPLGMRLNNPGNLRSAVGPDTRTVRVSGFARFTDLHAGCESLFYLINSYRVMGHAETVESFIGRYAPASENDVSDYVRRVVTDLKIPPSAQGFHRLTIGATAGAVALARSIISVEQGPVPRSWYNYPEWIDPGTLVDAIRATGKWPL
jgi:hypothetical protein